MYLDKNLIVKVLLGGVLIRLAPYILWEALKFLIICAIIYAVVKIYPLMNSVERFLPLIEQRLGDRAWILRWVTQKFTPPAKIPPNYKSLGVKELKSIVKENKIKVPTVGSGKDGRVVKYDLVEAIRNM